MVCIGVTLLVTCPLHGPTDGKLYRLPPEGSALGWEGDKFASGVMCLLSGRCQGFDLVLVYGVDASSMEHLKDPFLATFRDRIKATPDVLHSVALYSSTDRLKVVASFEKLGLDKGLGWVGFMFAQRRYRSTRSDDACGVWIQEDVRCHPHRKLTFFLSVFEEVTGHNTHLHVSNCTFLQ